tara:strand:- start:757 stop:981 length:225 start_codon:yes stop_codon:yes gene_type:complete
MTLREFSWFRDGWVEAHSSRWDHTSSMMALLANINSTKGKTFRPDDFHPFLGKSNQGVQSKEEAFALLEKMRNF